MKKREPRQAFFFERVTGAVGSSASLILHTLFFIAAFGLGFSRLLPWDMVLLVLTTAVSLEAIYLAIFIQMSVNRNTESLREVEEDVEDIQEDIEDIGEEVKELGEGVEDIQEEIEELADDEERDEERKKRQAVTLNRITADIERLLADIEALKRK